MAYRRHFSVFLLGACVLATSNIIIIEVIQLPHVPITHLVYQKYSNVR